MANTERRDVEKDVVMEETAVSNMFANAASATGKKPFFV